MDKKQELAGLYRMFADATRLALLFSLSQGEKSVSQLVNESSISQSAVSHQLRLLKDSKLIKARRDGQNVMYSLADDHVALILSTGVEHVNEED